MMPLCSFRIFLFAIALLLAVPPVRAIVGGSATGTPPDSPEARLDTLGAASPFNAVGALAMFSGGQEFRGSAIVLSDHWVLTCAHNLDIDSNGAPDAGLRIDLHLPGYAGAYSASGFHIHPSFTGFNNPSITDDIALLYFADTLPASLTIPGFKTDLQIGDRVTMVGFGFAGYGDVGYTTRASLTDRRSGENLINGFTYAADDSTALLYDVRFDPPDSPDSLGNNIESTIGPGDSGGALLYWTGTEYLLAGVNTYSDYEDEDDAGKFGILGGGVVITPYLEWIETTMATSAIPEPASASLLVGLALGGLATTRRRRR